MKVKEKCPNCKDGQIPFLGKDHTVERMINCPYCDGTTEREVEMGVYHLTYKSPYEYDEDSPSGIGDHSILWAESKVTCHAKSDEGVKEQIAQFLEAGSIVFNHYSDGDRKTYKRQFVGLTKELDYP